MGFFDQMSGSGRSYIPSGDAPVNMWGGGSGGGGLFSGMANAPLSMYVPPMAPVPMAPTPPALQAPMAPHTPPSLRSLLRQGPAAFAHTDIPPDFLRLMMFAAY